LQIKVAVVGLGKMGISHLSILNALDAFDVVAMCDSSRMVGKILERYTGIDFVEDYDQLLARPDLDAVVISTPTALHAAMVRQALDRGLHVFCEKPLTLSGELASELAGLAESKGLVAQVGYHNRFIGTFHEAQELIAGGALGRVRHVLAEAYGPVVLRPSKATWRSTPEQGGGCLYDYAAHPLNLLNWMFGLPEACLSSDLKSTYSAQVEDEVYASLRFPGATSAHLSVNWSDPSVRKMTTRLSVWGEFGKLYVDRQELQLFLDPSATVPDGYERGWNVKYITDLTPPVSFYLRGEEYSAQLEAFGEAIAAKKPALRNDFRSAAATDLSIEMIRAGRVLNLPEAKAPEKPRALLSRVFGR
jgi:predicted dehydrogenase